MKQTLDKRNEKQKDAGMKWKEVPLGDVLSYEQPTKYIVQSEDYDDSYQTPVLTAGKSFILGYTNETENIYENLPAIIFDDFTADSKYVDFPFKVKSSAMKILTCNPNMVDIRFAFYLMQTLKVDTEQHKRYWISKFSNISVPLPPLPIQKRIAEILDAADALRKKDQELLKKYDELAQAIFIDMFGDPVKNEKGWEMKKIGQIVKSEDHLRVPIESAVRATRQGQYPYYGASGIIDCFDDYIFNGTRLLIGEDGANLLARSTPIAFLAHGKYWVNNHAHVLNSDNLSMLTYLEFWFNSISLKPYITGSAQPKLNGSKLMEIEVPMPDKESLQSFDLANKSILIQKNKVCPSNQLFQGILKNSFSGDLVS
jgi:type I restriction enzyme S subunit